MNFMLTPSRGRYVAVDNLSDNSPIPEFIRMIIGMSPISSNEELINDVYDNLIKFIDRNNYNIQVSKEDEKLYMTIPESTYTLLAIQWS